MDRYTYGIKSDKIRKQIRKEDYDSVVKIADTIEWKEVRDAHMLTKVAMAYEKVGQYDRAIDLMLLAYAQVPSASRYLYRIADLYIKAGDAREAEAHYNMYREDMPDDNMCNLLKYRILTLEKAPLEDRIEALEAFINDELDEEWGYRLAELYRENGEIDKCARLCSQVILYFGEGEYVDKALDLKERVVGLTPEQQRHRDNKQEFIDRLNRVITGDYSEDSFEEDYAPETADADPGESGLRVTEAAEGSDVEEVSEEVQSEEVQSEEVQYEDATEEVPDEVLPDDGYRYSAEESAEEPTAGMNEYAAEEPTAGMNGYAAEEPTAGMNGYAAEEPAADMYGDTAGEWGTEDADMYGGAADESDSAKYGRADDGSSEYEHGDETEDRPFGTPAEEVLDDTSEAAADHQSDGMTGVKAEYGFDKISGDAFEENELGVEDVEGYDAERNDGFGFGRVVEETESIEAGEPEDIGINEPEGIDAAGSESIEATKPESIVETESESIEETEAESIEAAGPEGFEGSDKYGTEGRTVADSDVSFEKRDKSKKGDDALSRLVSFFFDAPETASRKDKERDENSGLVSDSDTYGEQMVLPLEEAAVEEPAVETAAEAVVVEEAVAEVPVAETVAEEAAVTAVIEEVKEEPAAEAAAEEAAAPAEEAAEAAAVAAEAEIKEEPAAEAAAEAAAAPAEEVAEAAAVAAEAEIKEEPAAETAAEAVVVEEAVAEVPVAETVAEEAAVTAVIEEVKEEPAAEAAAEEASVATEAVAEVPTVETVAEKAAAEETAVADAEMNALAAEASQTTEKAEGLETEAVSVPKKTSTRAPRKRKTAKSESSGKKKTAAKSGAEEEAANIKGVDAETEAPAQTAVETEASDKTDAGAEAPAKKKRATKPRSPRKGKKAAKAEASDVAETVNVPADAGSVKEAMLENALLSAAASEAATNETAAVSEAATNETAAVSEVATNETAAVSEAATSDAAAVSEAATNERTAVSEADTLSAADVGCDPQVDIQKSSEEFLSQVLPASRKTVEPVVLAQMEFPGTKAAAVAASADGNVQAKTGNIDGTGFAAGTEAAETEAAETMIAGEDENIESSYSEESAKMVTEVDPETLSDAAKEAMAARIEEEKQKKASASRTFEAILDKHREVGLRKEGQQDMKVLFISANPSDDGVSMAVMALREFYARKGEKPPVASKIDAVKLNGKGLLSSMPRLEGRNLVIEHGGALEDSILKEIAQVSNFDAPEKHFAIIDTPSAIIKLRKRYDAAEKELLFEHQQLDEDKDDFDDIDILDISLDDSTAKEEQASNEAAKTHADFVTRRIDEASKAAPLIDEGQGVKFTDEGKPEYTSEVSETADKTDLNKYGDNGKAEAYADESDGAEAAAEAGKSAGAEAAAEAGKSAGAEAAAEAGKSAEPEAGTAAGESAEPEAEAAADKSAEPEAEAVADEAVESDGEGAAGEQADYEKADETGKIKKPSPISAIKVPDFKKPWAPADKLKEEGESGEDVEADTDDDEELEFDSDQILEEETFFKYVMQYAKRIDCYVEPSAVEAIRRQIETMVDEGDLLTVEEAEMMVEDAADAAEKLSIASIFGSRYTKEGLLILKGRHFVH